MTFPGTHAKREPLTGISKMSDSGGGWIVTSLVFEDRCRV